MSDNDSPRKRLKLTESVKIEPIEKTLQQGPMEPVAAAVMLESLEPEINVKVEVGVQVEPDQPNDVKIPMPPWEVRERENRPVCVGEYHFLICML